MTASRTDSGSPRASSANRLQVRGKSLYEGDTKLHVRGVTYGTFRPDEETSDFPSVGCGRRGLRRHGRERRQRRPHVHRAAALAARPGERARALRDGRAPVGGARRRSSTTASGPRRSSSSVREMVRSCAGHPAILCYAIGNEIPASIVRWHGKRRIERFLKRLYHAAKSEDPGALVTYVNYPSTEYLSLPFIDLVVLQRVPRVGPAVRVLPGPAAAHRRRPPAGRHRGRPRLAAQLRGGPGAGARLAGTDRVRRRLRRACSCSRGPTSGTAAASTSTTGPSASSTATARPKQALATVGKAYLRGAVHARTRTGRASRWSSARTTARARCAAASTACATWTTRTTR